MYSSPGLRSNRIRAPNVLMTSCPAPPTRVTKNPSPLNSPLVRFCVFVDNHHLVAWEATTSYEIRKAAAGWISSFTSGEGFVCRFKGPGAIYVQTRSPAAFAGWLSGYLTMKH